MADQFMRIGGRGDDGTAKPFKTDNNGKLDLSWSKSNITLNESYTDVANDAYTAEEKIDVKHYDYVLIRISVNSEHEFKLRLNQEIDGDKMAGSINRLDGSSAHFQIRSGVDFFPNSNGDYIIRKKVETADDFAFRIQNLSGELQDYNVIIIGRRGYIPWDLDVKKHPTVAGPLEYLQFHHNEARVQILDVAEFSLGVGETVRVVDRVDVSNHPYFAVMCRVDPVNDEDFEATLHTRGRWAARIHTDYLGLPLDASFPWIQRGIVNYDEQAFLSATYHETLLPIMDLEIKDQRTTGDAVTGYCGIIGIKND